MTSEEKELLKHALTALKAGDIATAQTLIKKALGK